jgi:hypothetical protein
VDSIDRIETRHRSTFNSHYRERPTCLNCDHRTKLHPPRSQRLHIHSNSLFSISLRVLLRLAGSFLLSRVLIPNLTILHGLGHYRETNSVSLVFFPGPPAPVLNRKK